MTKETSHLLDTVAAKISTLATCVRPLQPQLYFLECPRCDIFMVI